MNTLALHSLPQIKWLADFVSPPAEYRSMPLWVWNGEVTPERITEMLEQYAAQGIGGVFIHPRPGLITEYLSERWMELYAFAIQESKRLGLICNVYDENSYPSCFAGGHVPSRIPYAAAQSVKASVWRKGSVIYGSGLALGVWRLNGGSPEPLPQGETPEAALKNGPVLLLEAVRSRATGWTAWFPMPDVTRPEVAREFINTTYQAYYERFKEEFGGAIKIFFADEPHIALAEDFAFAELLPYSNFIEREFLLEHGYPLIDRLPNLFVNHAGCEATRFDYYKTLQRLLTHNFVKQIYDWCGEHKVSFLGHYFEHEWPLPCHVPEVMDAYRFFHIPGIDLLTCYHNFTDWKQNDLFTLTIRELQSVANQMGRSRAFCEAYGVGSYASTFEEFKAVSDWLMVNGINFICQHLSFSSIAGARKYDNPQTFSDHTPWWPDYHPLADHIARLSVALSQGKIRNRVLLLHPTSTGWIQNNPFDPKTLARKFFIPYSEALLALQQSQAGLIQYLCDHQIDFDLGSELLMKDLASVRENKLVVGECSYDVLVIPPLTRNLFASTLPLLETWLAAGGIIYSLGPSPDFVDGRPDDRPKALAGKYYGRQWLELPDRDALGAAIRQKLPPYATSPEGKSLPDLIGHQQRVLEDGSRIHLFVNSAREERRLAVRLLGRGVQELNTFEGTSRTLPVKKEHEHVVADLVLPPWGHCLLLVVDKELGPEAVAVSPPGKLEVQSDLKSIERCSSNVLMLDFCDLEVSGRCEKGLYVTHANRKVWQAHGLEGNPWDRAVQFRRNFIDMKFDAQTSGYSICYSFEAGAGAADALNKKGELELALEHPELYRVELNGQVVDFKDSRRWLDETIRAAKVSGCLQEGLNQIRLTAKPFSPLCEIDRIYLLGDFYLEPTAVGWCMLPPRPLAAGEWQLQGMPFYHDAVRYQVQIKSARRGKLRVQVPRWSGSVIRVLLDAEDIGQIAFPPYELCSAQEIEAGEHEIGIEVVGNLCNLLGPHFTPPGDERITSSSAWDEAPATPAPGKGYYLHPFGLLGPLHWGVCE